MTDDELIEAALAEDVGDGDATTAATVDEAARGRATITQKAPGVISGLGLAAEVFRHLDPSAAIQLGPEGVWREAGAVVLVVEGGARSLLTAERTALNFLGRLSGIATLTARVVSRGPGRGRHRADPRHAQDHAGAAAAREGGGRARRRRQPPRRASTTRS